MSAKQNKNIKTILVYFHCMILYTWFFGGVRVAHLFSFFYVVLLCGFTFWVVLSIAILAQKRCSVRLYLQLCVGGHISYLCYLCLLTCSGVRQIYCCVIYVCWRVVVPNRYIVVFFFCFSSFYAFYVASFFEWSIFACPFGIL